MLINDSLDNNRIIDYDISFDNESKKTVLEILEECFSKRKISLPIKETILLQKGHDLSDLKRKLETPTKTLMDGVKDLSMYYYTYSELKPKRSILGDMFLGEETLVSRTEISCSLSSIVKFILHHVSEKECQLFMSKLTSMEKTYVDALLNYGGFERMSVLLGSIKDIETFLEKCRNFEELIMPENVKLLERIRYFRLVYSLATLTASNWYDRANLISWSNEGDEMEREIIQDIQDASIENTTMIKVLKLEPKRIIYNL